MPLPERISSRRPERSLQPAPGHNRGRRYVQAGGTVVALLLVTGLVISNGGQPNAAPGSSGAMGASPLPTLGVAGIVAPASAPASIGAGPGSEESSGASGTGLPAASDGSASPSTGAGDSGSAGPAQTSPSVTPAPTPSPTASPTLQPVQGSFALGLWSGQPWQPGDLDAAISLIGRPPAIFMTYEDWANRPASSLADDAWAIASRGASWVVTWEPFDYSASSTCQPSYSLQSIASGAHDAFITSWASAAAAWGGTIYLRFMHEMNGNWYPWGVDGGHCGNTPNAFIAAWRHTHDLFVAAGATNVKWVWSPNVEYPGEYAFGNLYPGKAYVDWVALDGYNWGGQVAGHPGWQSLRSIFQSSYNQLLKVAPGKPIMIAETASAQAGGDKASWILNGYLSAIPKYMPHIRAVIYFNQNAETAFRIDSSPESLAAFRQVAASEVWQGRIP